MVACISKEVLEAVAQQITCARRHSKFDMEMQPYCFQSYPEAREGGLISLALHVRWDVR
jgi:hypothetical protein